MKTYIRPSEAKWGELCVRPALAQKDLDSLCKAVFKEVRRNGDKAVLKYTEQFDGIKLPAVEFGMSDARKQAKQTPEDLQTAINTAYKNIRRFHDTQKLQSKKIETTPGVVCWQESRPVNSVGLYVPGGSAPLVSTVLMLGVPAQIAGSREIVLVTPPQKDGLIDPAICYAAQLVGITKVLRVGGMQAIAALSIGTQSAPKVDKIFGPGNQYVTAAKQYAGNYGVAIDMPAGPSEVLVIADNTARAEFVAADLLSQAEHGPDSQVVLLTNSAAMMRAVTKELKKQLQSLPRQDIARQALDNSLCICFANLGYCMDFANLYAPEHIILSVKNPKLWAKKVKNAGSVFLGNYSPESAGDYASGTNHTLPTAGWARSYGGVSLDSFVKKVTFQTITKQGLQALAPAIERLATAEGLDAHARAVAIRTQAK